MRSSVQKLSHRNRGWGYETLGSAEEMRNRAPAPGAPKNSPEHRVTEPIF